MEFCTEKMQAEMKNFIAEEFAKMLCQLIRKHFVEYESVERLAGAWYSGNTNEAIRILFEDLVYGPSIIVELGEFFEAQGYDVEKDLDLAELAEKTFTQEHDSYMQTVRAVRKDGKIEFYDYTQDQNKFPGGQFVSRYYLDWYQGAQQALRSLAPSDSACHGRQRSAMDSPSGEG